jgi:hypothetical protein
MPIFRVRVWAAPIVLAAIVFLPATDRLQAAPDPVPSEASKSAGGVEVEIKCIDDSVLKVKLLDDKLELATKYGVLQIAVADVRRIEFGHRCPPDVTEKIVLNISKLGSPDFQTRERASAELKSLRERAYPYLLKAIKHDDPEISRRADEAVKYIQTRVPAAQLETKDADVVLTEDSKFVGKLAAHSLRVNTIPFGEQQLKLADVRSLKSAVGVALEDLGNVAAAPTNLMTYQQQYGKELAFTVVGFANGNGQQASVWGTDLYSLDSNLAAAAVHAGFARPGEPATVRVRIVQSPPQFVASFRNGITSTAYGNYPAGAFEFVRR